MDICLIRTEEGTDVLPLSIHGMLWLQTHFETEHWNAIASRQVKLPLEDSQNLFNDACEAGLKLNFIPSLSIAKKF